MTPDLLYKLTPNWKTGGFFGFLARCCSEISSGRAELTDGRRKTTQ
jgi:hypothetical protein